MSDYRATKDDGNIRLPRVSILMSVHNNAPFLSASITSILQQTYRDFEFIVIDDASTDASLEILHAVDDPRMIIVHNTENLKLAASLNRGLSYVSGEYIARMDGDDIALPQRIAAQVAFMDAHPDIDVVGTERLHLYNNNRVYPPYTPLETIHSMIAWRIFLGLPFVHPTLMLSTKILQHVGGYNEQMIYGGQDNDLYVRLLGNARFANLSAPHLVYRQHDNSVTKTHKDHRHVAVQTRLAVASTLTGMPVTLELWQASADAWYNSRRLSVDEAIEVRHFLTALFRGIQTAGYFLKSDVQQVQADLDRRLNATYHNTRTYNPRRIIRRFFPLPLRRLIRNATTGQSLEAVLRNA